MSAYVILRKWLLMSAGRNFIYRLPYMFLSLMERVLEGHQGPVYSVGFNGDGTMVASASDDKLVAVWDIDAIPLDADASEDCSFYTMDAQKAAVTCVLWSNVEDAGLYTSAADGSVFAFDLCRGEKTKTFAHSQCVNEIAISKRDVLASVCDDGALRIYDMRSKDPASELETRHPLLTTVFDPSETYVYCSGIDPTVGCYDLRKLNDTVWAHTPQKRAVTSLAVSERGDYLVSKSLDGTIKYFDASGRTKPYVLEGPATSEDDWLVRAGVYESGAEMHTVLSGSSDGILYAWDLATRKTTTKRDFECGAIYDVDYHQGTFVAACENGAVVLGKL